MPLTGRTGQSQLGPFSTFGKIEANKKSREPVFLSIAGQMLEKGRKRKPLRWGLGEKKTDSGRMDGSSGWEIQEVRSLKYQTFDIIGLTSSGEREKIA